MIALWFGLGLFIATAGNLIHAWAVVPRLREEGFDMFVGWFNWLQFQELATYREICIKRGNSLFWWRAEIVSVALVFVWISLSLYAWISWLVF